jgi:hypothetical protein
LTKPITALPALRPSISPISMGTELPEKVKREKWDYFIRTKKKFQILGLIVWYFCFPIINFVPDDIKCW